jgi:hypothetical protein
VYSKFMLKTNDESIQISMLFDDNSNNTDSTSSKVRDDIKVEELTFSDKSQSYCVCFVSMVDSIGFTFQIN